MKKSDFDKLNPKSDVPSGLSFFNRGNLSSNGFKNNKSTIFYITFMLVFGLSLIILFNSSFYLKNYGDSLKALAISLTIILLLSYVVSTLTQNLLKKRK